MKSMYARMSRASRSRTLRVFAVVGVVVLCSVATASAGKLEHSLIPVMENLQRDMLEEAKGQLVALQATYPDAAQIDELLGEIHWRLGKLSQARTHFEKAQQLDPKSATARAGLALVEFSQGDLDHAEEMARNALEIDKKLWLAHYVMGRVFLEKNDINRAFEEFLHGKDLKKRVDGRDLFEAGMGLVGLAENDPEGAETNLIRARGMASNTIDHVVNLAAMYEATEQWGQAANILETMTQQVGENPQLCFRLGRAYEMQQRWNDALKEYQTALQADSTYAPAMAALGHLFLLDTRQTARAVQILSRAVELHPTVGSRLDLGIALTRANHAKEAIPHLLAAQQAENSIEVRLALARAYLNAGQDEEGLALMEKDVDVRLEAKPSDHVLMGMAYIRSKRNAEARKSLEKALEGEPDNVEAQYQLGYVDLLDKNYEAAIPRFQKKLEEDPKAAKAWLNLGIAYTGLNDMESAVNAYRKAAEIAPNSSTVWLQLAQALSVAENIPEAQQAFGKALELDPKNGTALRGRGFTYLIQEKYPEAINDLRVATQVAPNDVQSWVWLGQALLNNGKPQEARPAFEKAIQLEPGNESAREGLEIIGGSF